MSQTLELKRVGREKTEVVIDQAPIQGYDLDEEEVKPLGLLQVRGYEDGTMARLVSQSLPVEGEEPRVSQLGIQKTPGAFLDPWAIQEPFLNAGWNIDLVDYGRNGGRSTTLLYHPELTLKDTISWDHARHLAQQERTNLGPGDETLKLGILAKGKIASSTRYTLTLGFIRWVCRNGLVSSAFEMGSLVVSPATFEPLMVQDWIGQIVEDFSSKKSVSVTAYEAKTSALDYPIEMMQKALLDQIQGKQGAEPQLDFDELPEFVSNPLGYIAKQPIWFQESLLDQAKLLRKSQETFTSLDVLNMVTNPGAFNQQQSRSRLYNKMEGLQSKMEELILVGSFFAKVDLPKKVTVEIPVA